MTTEESTVQNQCFKAEDHDLSSQSTFSPREYSATNNEESLQVLRNFLKQYPWSVSDPGLPSSRVESPPREYNSSPLLMGGSEEQKLRESSPLLMGELQVEEQNRDQGNYNSFLVSNSLFHVLRKLRPKTLGNKDFLKWVFIVLNVLVEFFQAVFAQEKNNGKIGRQTYLKLSIITSSICLMMVLVEAFHDGKRYGVVWQQRGYCCWFYYPGNEGRLFGKFSLYFGLISSMIQLIINLTEKLAKKDLVKFDYMPLLLAVCYLAAAIIASREKTSSTI